MTSKILQLILAWFTKQLPGMVVGLLTAISEWIGLQKKKAEEKETLEKYEEEVKAGKSGSREKRRGKLKDAINSAGK